MASKPARTPTIPKSAGAYAMNKPAPLEAPAKPTFHSFPSNKVRPIRKTPVPSVGDVLKVDYDHKKFFTLKTKSLVDVGQALTLHTKSSVKLGEKTTPTGAVVPNPIPEIAPSFVRLMTSVNRFGLDARVWGDGRFKLAIDGGYLNPQTSNDNIFALFRSTTSFSTWKVGLGLVHNLNPGSYVLGRFRLDNTMAPLVDVKTMFAHKNWRVFENIGLNLSNNQILRAHAFLAYLDKDFDFVLAHESMSKKLELGRIVASLIYRYNKYSFAVQSRVKNAHARFIFGVSAPLNENTTLKAKIDDRFKFTTASKIKLHKNCVLSVASQVRLAQGKNAFDFTKPLPVPLGMSLDWTI